MPCSRALAVFAMSAALQFALHDAALPQELLLFPDQDCFESALPTKCGGPPLEVGFLKNPITAPLSFVIAADLDADGDPDLASAAFDQVFITLTNADGTFAESISYRAGIGPGPLLAEDFDLDGDRDLLVANQGSRNLSLLVNRGDATFEQPSSFDASGDSSVVLQAGDLDGDEDLDAVVGWFGRNRRLENLGGGKFRYAGEIFSAGPFTLIDVIGNALLDIVVAQEREPRIEILRNDGNWTFTHAGTFPLPQRAAEVLAVDLDHMLGMDVLVRHWPIVSSEGIDILIGVFLADSKRSLAKPVFYKGGTFNPAVAVGDLDLDGDQDVTLLEDQNGISLLLNDGAGHLAAPVRQELDVGFAWVATGDFDGDGDLDLVNGDSLLRNVPMRRDRDCNGNGVPDTCEALLDDCNANCTPDDCDVSASLRFNLPSFHGGVEGQRFLGILDADMDGDLDLLSGGLSVLYNQGDGSFQGALGLSAISPNRIATGDLDGDGDGDIAFALEEIAGQIRISFNDGTGSFLPGPVVQTGSRPSAVVARDFDGDRDLDLAAVNSYGENIGFHVAVYINAGNAVYDRGGSFPAGPGDDANASLAAADLDGDTDLDLVAGPRGVTTTQGFVAVLFNHGRALFSPPAIYQVGAFITSVSLGDLDGDRDVDIVVSTPGSQSFSLLMNDGAGVFPVTRELSFQDYPSFARLGDLDGDEDLDIAVGRSAGFQRVTVFRNNGRAEFKTIGLPVPVEPLYMEIADISGDRRPDLLVNIGLGFYVLLNESLPPASADENRDLVPDDCKGTLFHRGDANDDGGVGIADATFIINHQFRGGPRPICSNAADSNGDEKLDIADCIFLLNHLFLGGASPPPPGPPPAPCGIDGIPSGHRLLSCEMYHHCS